MNPATAAAEPLLQQWGILLATALSPVIAVLITLWYQRRDREYQLKLGVFTKLMQFRRNKLSPEYVGALNLVPVVFYKNQAVRAAFDNVLRATSDPSWNVTQDDPRFVNVMNALTQRVETETVKLLEQIASDMKIGVDQLTVLQGSYHPEGWVNSSRTDEEIKRRLLDMLSGQQPLPVRLADPPSEEVNNSAAPPSSLIDIRCHLLMRPFFLTLIPIYGAALPVEEVDYKADAS